MTATLFQLLTLFPSTRLCSGGLSVIGQQLIGLMCLTRGAEEDGWVLTSSELLLEDRNHVFEWELPIRPFPDRF